MNRGDYLIAAALLVLTTGCDKGGEYQVRSGMVSGRVIAVGDSTPVAGATVEVGTSLTNGLSTSTVTDGNGKFSTRVSWFTAYENPRGMVRIAMKLSKADFDTLQLEAWAFAFDGAYYNLTMTPTSTCTWPAEVSVAPGVSPPTFTWTPPCNMWHVIVADTTGGEQWRLVSFLGNTICPPVLYGHLAPGASSYTNAAVLTPGQRYTISLYRWTGPGPEDAVLAGQTTFSP